MTASLTELDRKPSSCPFLFTWNGSRFEYWHIAPAVKVGQRVIADETVLGRILHGSGHVHLTEVDNGRVTDPLLPGHLTPYRDTTRPDVTGSLPFANTIGIVAVAALAASAAGIPLIAAMTAT